MYLCMYYVLNVLIEILSGLAGAHDRAAVHTSIELSVFFDVTCPSLTRPQVEGILVSGYSQLSHTVIVLGYESCFVGGGDEGIG